jgi:hypothetical protein
MKFKLLAMTALCGVFAVACGKSSSDTSSSGGGDSGGGGVGGSSNVTTASMNNTTTGAQLSCAETFPNTCGGDGMTAGCLDCALTDDPTVASDAGVCLDSYETCFGTDPATACGTGGDPACCSFVDCLNACPADDPATADVDENLNCICTNDGTQCTMDQTDPNTCLGADGGLQGAQEYIAIIDCLFGQDGMSGTCGTVPDCQN